MTTASLVFFLARAYQYKLNKIRITIFAHTKLKLCILQDKNHLKSIYLATFYSPRKIPETMHLIFLSNTTLQDETKKNLVHKNWTLLALDINF